MFGDEIMKDLTLFFVGSFRQSLAEQSKVLVMKESIHDDAPHITGASYEPTVTERCLRTLR